MDYAERITGVPAAAIRDLAHAYARADRAQLCWTLGITEHHNAVDNVFALVNLALLTGHVGRYGSGLVPLRGQNNVQGGGDMGAIPNKLPGGYDVEILAEREPFERTYGHPIPAKRGWHLSEMFDAMERGALTTLYIVGENPAQSEADQHRTIRLLKGLDHVVVQDMFLTKTAELASVVLPASASWCESEGTVTSSERRVQRVRKALEPPEGAREDGAIIMDLARRLGYDWHYGSSEDVWNELRELSEWHRGMSYARLEELDGLQWPCPTEDHPGSRYLHERLWHDPVEGPRAAFHAVDHTPPVDELTDEYPVRLTTGRRLDGFNTGVQTGGYTSPLRKGETIDIHPVDADRIGIVESENVLVTSRRGSIEVPAHLDPTLRPGLAFMSFHFSNQSATNILTIDAVDPASGTAEFKAAAIRIEKLGVEAASKTVEVAAAVGED